MSVLFTRLYLCAMREIPFLISFSTNTYISTSEKKFFYASLDIIRYFYRFSNLISLSYFQYQFFYQVFHLNCQLLRFSWLVRILIHDKYWSLQRKKLVRLQMHFLREELYLLNCEYRKVLERCIFLGSSKFKVYNWHKGIQLIQKKKYTEIDLVIYHLQEVQVTIIKNKSWAPNRKEKYLLKSWQHKQPTLEQMQPTKHQK